MIVPPRRHSSITTRQVGKTTLARRIATERDAKALFLDLERPGDAVLLKGDPVPLLLAQGGRLV